MVYKECLLVVGIKENKMVIFLGNNSDFYLFEEYLGGKGIKFVFCCCYVLVDYCYINVGSVYDYMYLFFIYLQMSWSLFDLMQVWLGLVLGFGLG